MLRNDRSLAALVLSAMLLIAANSSGGAEPLLVAKAGRGVSKVNVQAADSAVVIDATSPGGIGQITVQSGGQPWPMAVKLRLRYDEKRSFTHLEGFTLKTARAQLHTFLGGEDVEVTYRDGVQRPLAAKPEMKIARAGGAIEVTLPMAWLADEKEFVMHWVDFYRG